MILADANLLVYAKFADMPQHPDARRWLEERLNSRARFGLPWASAVAFLRLSTNPRLFRRPLTMSAAWQQVEEWLRHPRVWVPRPTEEHATVLGGLLDSSRASANLVPDAHLAAIAIEHGLTLCSADSDFARFPGLKWLNPLE